MVLSRKKGTVPLKDNGETRAGSLFLVLRKLSVPTLLLLLPLAMGSCAPKQVFIPVAERAALENQRIQEMEADRAASAAAREKMQQGKDGQGGITEQDISGGIGPNRNSEGRPSGAPANDIYFDYDSYVLKKADLVALKEFSVWLHANSRVNLTIEGHCDERGSIEYNLALGQKRAEAVREHLITLGVEKGRMKTISYGKEIPTAADHTEKAWAKNRRAHMKID
jgi:peptidoglycan-associated lipoprotein